MTPSRAVSVPPVFDNSMSSSTEATLTGISKRCVWRARGSRVITALMPKISRRFAMQLPATLPNAMSAWPSTAETTETTSSGMAVPTATTVRPMTRSGRPTRAAIWLDPLTSKSAPQIRSANPIMIKTSCRSMASFLIRHAVDAGPVTKRARNVYAPCPLRRLYDRSIQNIRKHICHARMRAAFSQEIRGASIGRAVQTASSPRRPRSMRPCPQYGSSSPPARRRSAPQAGRRPR